MALRRSIDVGAGVLDSDYRGEVKVLLVNNGEEPYEVRLGDRIAQLLLLAHAIPPVAIVNQLDATARGAGGFGSTGK
jgi:dUTP pyrophosphatase